MQNLYIKTEGIKYLAECLRRYNGSTGYLVLFFVLAIFIFIKGTEKEKRIFIPLTVIMIITVYNPVFPIVLAKFSDISNEYYRFFWITPVIVLVPYVLTKFVLFIKDTDDVKINKTLLCCLSVLILCFVSSFIYGKGIDIAENIYKIPDELIEIDKIIHNDSEDEYPKAFFDYEYNMMIRQYDPKMLLTIDREDYINAMIDDYTTDEIYDAEHPQYRILAALARYQTMENKTLTDGFEMTGTEYIVLPTGSTQIERLENYGLTCIGQTKSRTILKYNLQNKSVFELVDYSEVYENGW